MNMTRLGFKAQARAVVETYPDGLAKLIHEVSE